MNENIESLARLFFCRCFFVVFSSRRSKFGFFSPMMHDGLLVEEKVFLERFLSFTTKMAKNFKSSLEKKNHTSNTR